jgi:fructose-bisphosphate aldolase class II
MVRTGQESFPGMVADVRRVAEMAHDCGVTVEGELGDADAEGAEVPGVSVEEARAFVQRTGVDCLSMPVCRSNGRTRGRARPDTDRLRRITEAVKVPLVVRAGNGLADEHYYRLIQHGVAKINCDRAVTEGPGEAVGAQAERCMRLWGSAGRAAEVLVQCRTWQPVQHVIVYNVEGADDALVAAMMARGREALGRIPGVRRVFTGWALQKSAKFRCCWLVEFVHEKVIDSYRDHPDHVAFANQLFRPIAGDRISIDFAEIARPAEAGVVSSSAYLATGSAAAAAAGR